MRTEPEIVAQYSMTAREAIGAGPGVRHLDHVALCLLVAKNGRVFVGVHNPPCGKEATVEAAKMRACEDAFAKLQEAHTYYVMETESDG